MSPSAAAPPTHHTWARIRLADRSDVPHLLRMIRQMAATQRLAHTFSATESSLSATLFPSTNPLPAAFQSTTVLLLELTPCPRPSPPPARPSSPAFAPQLHPVSVVQAPASEEEEFFISSKGGGGEGWVVAGFALVFPTYSTFLARPGIHVEDLFVREAYRSRGLGRLLLSAVAARAAEAGAGRVEWCVLDWNVKAVRFYQEMGADVLPEWRVCRLAGAALDAYRRSGGDDEGVEV